MSTRLPIARLTSIRCNPQFARTFGATPMSPVMSSTRGSFGFAVHRHLEVGGVLVRRALRGEQSRHAHPGRSIGCSGVTHGLADVARDRPAFRVEIGVQRAAATCQRRRIRAGGGHVRLRHLSEQRVGRRRHRRSERREGDHASRLSGRVAQRHVLERAADVFPFGTATDVPSRIAETSLD